MVVMAEGIPEDKLSILGITVLPFSAAILWEEISRNSLKVDVHLV